MIHSYLIQIRIRPGPKLDISLGSEFEKNGVFNSYFLENSKDFLYFVFNLCNSPNLLELFVKIRKRLEFSRK